MHDSPVIDETAHLPAGISHWQYGRFALYRVNPPLVRMVAALPLLVMEPKTDWSKFIDMPGARAEFGVSGDFLAANKNDFLRYFRAARFVCILFSLLGA